MQGSDAGATEQKKGPLNLSDEDGGRLIAGLVAVGAVLALWPAAILGALLLIGARALRLDWRLAAGGLVLSALPVLLMPAPGAALSRYLAVAPPWRVREAMTELGVLGLVAASWPIVLPAAAAIVLAGLGWDRARRSPEQALRRREQAEGKRLVRARERAGAPARPRRTLSSPQGQPSGLELGIYLAGDEDALPLVRKRRGARVEQWGSLPLDYLRRHTLVLGASGAGKTYTLLRICAQLAAQHPGWRIFYLDAKSRSAAGRMFPRLMRQSGRQNIAIFPEMAFDGWRGDPQELANRLIRSVPFGTEEGAAYYADTARQIVQLACCAPAGAPGSAEEFLGRLRRSVLAELYKDHARLAAVERLEDKEVDGAYRRFDAFFGGTAGALDGGWAYEDVDAAYLLVDTQRFGDAGPKTVNYLLEDFIQAIASRRRDERPALIVVDEFSAGARTSPAAVELVERLRELGGHAVLAPQVAAGLGDEDTRERILTSTYVKVLHQVPDPDAIAELAGTRMEIESSAQIQDGDATGAGSAREQHQRRVPSQEVRELDPGECFVIRQGRAARFQIALTPDSPDDVDEADPAGHEAGGAAPRLPTPPGARTRRPAPSSNGHRSRRTGIEDQAPSAPPAGTERSRPAPRAPRQPFPD